MFHPAYGNDNYFFSLKARNSKDDIIGEYFLQHFYSTSASPPFCMQCVIPQEVFIEDLI